LVAAGVSGQCRSQGGSRRQCSAASDSCGGDGQQGRRLSCGMPRQQWRNRSRGIVRLCRLRRQWAAREAAVAAAAAWQWWLVSAEMAAATDAAATECSANHLPPGLTQVPGVIAWGLCVPSQGRRAILQSALGLSRATGCRSCGPPPDGYFLIAGGRLIRGS